MTTKTTTTTQPPHPGVFLRRALLDPKNITVRDAAQALGVSRVNLSNVVHGHHALSPDLALRIEQVFGLPMEPLMVMQTLYDAAQTRHRAHPITVPRGRRDGGAR